MNIAIVEDNLMDLRTLVRELRDYAAEVGFDITVKKFVSCADFMSQFASGEYGIIFLDVYVGDERGNDIAKKIREQDNDVAIVFTTMSPDFAVEGFAVHALHYILKPVSKDEIAEVFSRYFAAHELAIKKRRLIEFPEGRSPVSIEAERIIYAETDGRHVRLHTASGREHVLGLTLKEVLARLPGSIFIQPHKSFIVNMAAVERMASDGFHMRSGAVVPIRVNGGSDVRRAYMQYLAKNGK